jgi:lactoylglutathione lyase|uniref:VOC family protein n=1 Tax=Fluviicola sp. TaxID=1917219 RepID=UPI00404A548F
MKKIILVITVCALSFLLGSFYQKSQQHALGNMDHRSVKKPKKSLKLGAFSMSLNVKDLGASITFYESLGFQLLGGDRTQNYVVLKNEHTIIGLFQGMFNENMLTFNPGWDDNAKNIKTFNDVREIHHILKNKGNSFVTDLTGDCKGPAYFIVKDPDGNVLLFDQHR